MAHQNSNNVNNSTKDMINSSNKAMFHDFLGMKPSFTSTDSPLVLPSSTTKNNPTPSILDTASPSASLSANTSAAPAASSERQVGNHLEGIPFYGPRSEISGPEISNRLIGSKRSNSDSGFTGSSRDGIPHMAHDSLESLHLMKMLKHGGDRPRRTNDDEILYGTQAMRPTSASLILQSSAGGRLDPNVSKWERLIPTGTAIQYPPRASQFVPFVHQGHANKSRDINASTSIISQSAADEGSRTGIKGQGILSLMNAGSGISEKNSSGALLSSSKLKSGSHVSEPKSTTPSSGQGLTSASRQMTIFYGGQAHVFDDVHPNKADVIMALAGSNGGSWSTTYSPKPVRPNAESYMTSGENEAGTTPDAAFQRELRGRLSGTGNIVGSGDRIISMPTGGHHGGNMTTDKTKNPVQTGESSPEEKRDI